MQFLRAWINLIFGFFFLEKLTRSSLAISRRVMSVFPQGCKTTNQSYKYFFELSIPVPEHEFSSLVSQFPSGYSGGVVFLTQGIPAWSPSSDCLFWYPPLLRSSQAGMVLHRRGRTRAHSHCFLLSEVWSVAQRCSHVCPEAEAVCGVALWGVRHHLLPDFVMRGR